MHNEFTAVIEPAPEGGFVAFCPEVEEANGQGETEAEALQNLRQAIELALEHKREQARLASPEARRTVVSIG